MKFVRSLSEAQRQELQEKHKNGSTHRERVRAQAVLLSARGYTLTQLSQILELDRDTLSQWIATFEHRGSAALADAPKSGRPHKLSEEVRQAVVDEVTANPSPQAKTTVLAQLKKTV